MQAINLPALRTVLLSDIVREIRTIDDTACLVGEDCPVAGSAIDSRVVEAGNLFICKGTLFKTEYLLSSLHCGAVAFMCEQAWAEKLHAAAPDVPYIVVSDVRPAMAIASALAFNAPDRDVPIVGITGTKGKSSTTCMLDSIIRASGSTPALIGSISTYDGVESFESTLTTPESPDLYRHLSNAARSGVSPVILEVSSQALKYDRVRGMRMAVGCFLNIGRDHISDIEHPTFEDYFESKKMIFDYCDAAVVNLSCEYADEISAAARECCGTVRTFGIDCPDADYNATDMCEEAGKLLFTVHNDGTEYPMVLSMLGDFNVSNALAALACARELGISWQAITEGLLKAHVPGRMEHFVSRDGKLNILVDNAHNDMSFHAFFNAVKAMWPDKKIIASFGAQGDKAHERRRILPTIAAQYSQHIIFTEDDAGHMPFDELCAEMAQYVGGVPCESVFERKDAAARAVEIACQDDPSQWVVCLLAKGTDTAQHRGDDTVFVQHDVDSAQQLIAAYDERTAD